MEEVGENMPSLAIEDDWIDDMEAPIIHHCNELIHIVNQYRHEATEHKCLPSFDGNRQHYETFRNAWRRYERNWRKFLLQEIRIHPNATAKDKIEAMSMIYEHMMEHLEHHLEGDALPFFYSLHRVGGTVFWPAFYQRVMQAFDETFISY
jgi:hypothetical protein